MRRASLLLLLFSVGNCPALDWEAGAGYRRAKLTVTGVDRGGFTLLSPEQTGVFFTNSLSQERALGSLILPSGSGVAAGDVDGDGWCDLYFTSLKTGNRLYRNLGNWRFEDMTQQAGVSCSTLDATGTLLVDLEGDGDLDLVVNSLGGGTHLFLNDGRGRFTESKEVLNAGLGGMSLAAADYDGDGDLDLYLANYRADSMADKPDAKFNLRMVDGRLVVASINSRPLTDPEWTNRFRFNITQDAAGRIKFSHEELGEPDALYRNLGAGNFERVPWTGGVFLDEQGKPLTEPPLDWGLSVIFRDLNGDGRPDLYVCNDFSTPDRFWVNDGKGRFRAIARTAVRQTPLSCMSIDVADIDQDGQDDIFVSEMLSRVHQRRLVQRTNLRPETLQFGEIENRPQYSRNMVFHNRGDGTYEEIAHYAGLEASEWSWTPIFMDVDLDGREDLLVANGFVRDNMNLDAMEAASRASTAQRISFAAMMEARRLFPVLATPNVAFRNLGGWRFVETGRQWGFDTPVISQGMCAADLDNDGDLDVAANNLNSVAGLYRNHGARPRVAVTLKGGAHNTRGIGARIKVGGGPVPLQTHVLVSGGRYLSCDQALWSFAAGAADPLRIEVEWPSGRRSVVDNASPNCLYEVAETGPTSPPPVIAVPNPCFEDVSALLSHRHREEPFDDFARQTTLSKRLSELGPGVCWADLRRRGVDDLIIGSGKGGSMAVFLNDGKGGFKAPGTPVPGQPGVRDQTAVVAWPAGSNATWVLAGDANYEDLQPGGGGVVAYDLAIGRKMGAVPGTAASVGPLALADVDADGKLELLVGERVQAGNYPQAVSSRLFRSRDGAFVPDESNNPALREVGMVSGAVFSDLNGDGFPELILACEWGPIRIFLNDRGRLTPWNPALKADSLALDPRPATLDKLTGWWTGVTTGDLDGDGRLDIVAGNWGENSKYQNRRSAPLRIYYGNYSGEEALGLIEAYFEPGMGCYVPEARLDGAARAMPSLRARFPTYEAFANARMDQVVEDQPAYLEASCLQSTVLFNRGNHWEARPLPPQAQLAPAFAVIVADYDGDGCEDVFLSQNFYSVEPETSRYDAGRGLWLRGDGRGSLRPVPGAESGVLVYGDQRGAAVADYDADGRVDLVVSQNSAPTSLFRNRLGKPGLRVRLAGPPGNPWGIGAQLRLKHGDRLGPLREVHGGSGYWSQDSPTQVLAPLTAPAQLWLRWPGGKPFVVDIPPASAEVRVGIDGSISRVK